MRKKDLVEMGITGLLILVLLAIVFSAFSRMNKKHSRKVLPAEELPLGEGSVNLFSKLEAETEGLELTRDPFSSAPIINTRVSPYGVQLSGIMWDKEKPVAIINGEIVKAGDTVDGKIVVAVKQDRVILDDGSKEIELTLGD
jgi:hypothetical protein